MPTWLQRIFLVIIFVNKGGPFHLISFGKKNYGIISNGILYRRSKKIPIDQHWNETRLGEISTSWSNLCKSPKDVLYRSTLDDFVEKKSEIIDKNQLRVYSCDLDFNDEKQEESYPFCKTIELNRDLIRIEVVHNKTICNYPHSEINCYLTTKDGEHNDEYVRSDNWGKHPLNSKAFRGLRGKYKTHLIYHFSDYQDFDLNH